MKVAIRVDASSQIGTGHFMRCMTLADSLKKRDAEVLFVSRHLPEHLRSLAQQRGHGCEILDGAVDPGDAGDLAHSRWLGTSQAADAQDTVKILTGTQWDWLIVDHYGLDIRWESRLRHAAKKIMVIDDIADRRHDCDMLLDQNYYADMDVRYTGKVPEHCQLLLGPKYALLRDEFRELRKQVKPRVGPVRRILVFFGGIDADNYTSLAIEALASMERHNIHVDVVIGVQHPYIEGIKNACVTYGFDCHVQTERMAELMASADLAIGAGGSTTWERCCLALPSIVFVLADNQKGIARSLEQLGCSHCVSERPVTLVVMREAIRKLLDQMDYLKKLSENSYSLVDGFGIDRVRKKLE